MDEDYVSARRAAAIVDVSPSYVGRLVRAGRLFGHLDEACRLQVHIGSLEDWAAETGRPLNGHGPMLVKLLAPFRVAEEKTGRCPPDCPGRDMDCLRWGCLLYSPVDFPEHVVKEWMENEWNDCA